MKTIYIQNTDLNRDKRASYLTEDVVSAGTTIRLQSIQGFQNLDTSSGQIVLIGEFGQERSEILRTSNVTAPSASYKEITLRDSLSFDHPQDSKVYIIDWNRADVEWSATATGAKSTLVAYPVQIQPDQSETLFVDTTQTSGFYFTRFNESIGNTNSDWSDPVAFGGYDDNTVFAIKKRALDEMNEVIDGNTITHEYLNQSLWEGRREYHQSPGKRPFRQVFNKVIGTALTGSYRIELPTDVEDPYGPTNIYNVKIGVQPDMQWIDKKEWDFYYLSKPHTSLVSAYTVGARDLYVSSARDFDNSGAITVEGTSVSYSDKSNTGGTLRISVQGSYNASAGSDVWQNISYGAPDKFTVWADPQGSAYIYFNRPIDTAYIGQNIYADYYRTLVGYDTDADVLDEPTYDMFVDFLKYKITQRKKRGEIPVIRNRQGGAPIIADANYQGWIAGKQSALQNEMISNKIHLNPGISHLQIPNDSPGVNYF